MSRLKTHVLVWHGMEWNQFCFHVKRGEGEGEQWEEVGPAGGRLPTQVDVYGYTRGS